MERPRERFRKAGVFGDRVIFGDRLILRVHERRGDGAVGLVGVSIKDISLSSDVGERSSGRPR